jgi:hypothetical protein
MDIDISEFDLNNLFTTKYNCFTNLKILIIAKDTTKKQMLIKKISQVFSAVSSPTLPYITTIAPADKYTNFYNNIDLSMNVHYEYKDEIVLNLLERQSYLINNHVNEIKTLLIIDDCVHSTKKFFNGQEINSLFFEGKNYQLSWILTIQFPIGIPPEYRMNFDCIFILDDMSYQDKRNIYHHYAGMFPNFADFDKIFNKTISNGKYLLINKFVKSSDINKNVFYVNLNIEERINKIISEIQDEIILIISPDDLNLNNTDKKIFHHKEFSLDLIEKIEIRQLAMIDKNEYHKYIPITIIYDKNSELLEQSDIFKNNKSYLITYINLNHLN